MKKFENRFVLKCLDYMKQILSTEHELEEAVRQFTVGQKDDPRYQLNSKIRDASQWSYMEKLQLSAAVFEAIARASILFYEVDPQYEPKITAANKVFLEKYLPKLTENTDPENRLDSVKENINHIKTEKTKEAAKVDKDNPYAFFTPVTAGLAVLAATAATVALLSRAR